MVCLSASVTRKTLFHSRRFLLNFVETQETFEKFPFSPQLLWLSPHWQSSIQLYSGKLWIFTKCHLNWHFLTFKRSLVENSENSSLKCFWCHLICLQSLNLKWKMFCDNLLIKLRLWRGCSFFILQFERWIFLSLELIWISINVNS